MGKRLLVAGCALMLTLCGCGNFKIVYEPPEEAVAEEAPVLELDKDDEPIIEPALLEEFPVEVDVDGITFRVPEEGDGWEAPDCSEGVNGPSASVFFQPPEQDPHDGNFGVIHLNKCGDDAGDDDVPDLGTDLPDTDYINAMTEYFRKKDRASSEMVFHASQWRVARDPGGVVCSCFYSEYPDPRLTGKQGYMTNGVQAYIFTDHGNYWFNSCYIIGDFENHEDEDAEIMLRIPLTLWAGKDS